jgi:uncharacterized protein (TIGR03437 family)
VIARPLLKFVQLTNSGVKSNVVNSAAKPLSLAFFTFDATHVTATHADGSLIGPATLYPGLSTPAKPGETIIVYANGFGPTTVPIVSGGLTQSGTLTDSLIVGIGGFPANVPFAGLVAPGEFQFNIVVPSSAPDGDLVHLGGVQQRFYSDLSDACRSALIKTISSGMGFESFADAERVLSLKRLPCPW